MKNVQRYAEGNVVGFDVVVRAETMTAHASLLPTGVSNSTVVHAQPMRAHATAPPATVVVSELAEPVEDERDTQE